MEEGLFEVVLRSANHIPSGRQLPRTPPMMSVKKHLDFEDVEPVMPNSNAKADGDVKVFGCSSLKMENPYTMLKGMKGYHLTPDDLNFIRKKAEEEHVKKLQEQLAETQALLKMEVKMLELALVSRATTQATFSLIPSSDDLANWAKLVLRETSPSDFTHLDTKSLLALIKMEEIQRLTDQKKKVIAVMEATAAETFKKEAEERGHLEMQVASEELKILELMRKLTVLKSDLLQQEFLFCFAWSLKQDGALSATAKENRVSKNETQGDAREKLCQLRHSRAENMQVAPSLSVEARCESLDRVRCQL
ncbi:uncharacterized protein LOC129378660 [Poeciliopsis prolifica]|uniref:uncharacterized protein LOC129378660 n=1 Tax=Poeciliopsis prolifica TaxID=188132 RepID=UPI002413E319|nr:uncharacterized protein LOC129378660 [Poeciliopsis prolifica]